MKIDYQKLTKELLSELPGITTKAAGTTPTATLGHGYGGLFSQAGLERPVFSAMILPKIGLQDMLPTRSSMYETPLFGVFTGVTASSGSEPDGVCDDPPIAGLSKLCMHQFVYGRRSRMTRVYDITEIGQQIYRDDHVDLQFMGSPFQGNNPNIPTIPGSEQMTGVLNTEYGKAAFELACSWSRDMARELYTANPTNNSAGGGNQYYYGLDILINTGYRDAVTGVACPAADSIVRDMNSLEVNTNGPTYVSWFTNILRRLKFIATQAGLMPATWTITMPWGLFYELTEVWPCAYATYRCSNAGTFDSSQSQTVDTQWMLDMRDAMRGDDFNRTGQYLLLDGQKVPVTIDDGVTETPLAGSSFKSSVYFVPLFALGRTPVTYMESLNFDAPNGAMEMARAMAPDGMYFTSDGGRFLWHRKPPSNWCVQALAITKPRVMLLTPHIAARMTNVKWTPLAHERDWDPDGSFYVDGGGTDQDVYGPSFYSPTS